MLNGHALIGPESEPSFLDALQPDHLIYDMPFADYVSSEGLSCSQLKHFDVCPKKYKYYILDGNEGFDSDALRFGRALHTFVLEPELFDQEFFVTEKIRRAGKAWQDLQFAAAEKEILWMEDFKQIEKMDLEIKKNKDMSKVLSQHSTHNEISMFWHDEQFKDIKLKGRIDLLAICNDRVIIVDLKTTRSAIPDDFSKDIFKLNYHLQAALYCDGYEAITGIKPDIFLFVAIEKNPPYLLSLHYIHTDSDTMKIARNKYRNLLQQYTYCLNKNNFNIGFDEALPVCIPTWYKC